MQVNQKQIDVLAAQLYYIKNKKDGESITAYEHIEDELKSHFKGEAAAFILAADKAGYDMVSQAEIAARIETIKRNDDGYYKDVDSLMTIIDAFTSQLKHPKGINKMFPAKELAFRIVHGTRALKEKKEEAENAAKTDTPEEPPKTEGDSGEAPTQEG